MEVSSAGDDQHPMSTSFFSHKERWLILSYPATHFLLFWGYTEDSTIQSTSVEGFGITGVNGEALHLFM